MKLLKQRTESRHEEVRRSDIEIQTLDPEKGQLSQHLIRRGLGPAKNLVLITALRL
jgi:hypothetical protein